MNLNHTRVPFWLYPLTGLLLVAGWPMSPLTFLLFFAWIPLLVLESRISSDGRFFWVSWLNMLIWNAGTTWWIWNSTGPGAAGAIIANSLLMVFPLMAFRYTRRWAGNLPGYASFILYWLTFEYIHHNWDLSWPWLTLGNALANQTSFIQWYEYTGTTGGSLWLLLVNVSLLYSFLKLPHHHKFYNYTLRLLVILGPMILSGLIYPVKHAPASTNVVVVQPNVEPYEEKFNTPPGVLVQELIRLSESRLDSNTRLVVWPETAIPAQAWEHKLLENPVFQPVYEFLRRHPQILLVTGIDSYRFWGTEHPGSFSIRQMNDGSYYEAFNTAMGVDARLQPQLYHKAKLVPGVESLPSWLGFMGELFDDFGGISGSLGRSDKAEVFSSPGNPYKPAPIICYESIYSNYATEYVRNGANIFTIITNDGWWGKTPGYRQHMSMARLRAIETRMWVARSANTGISCFIDPSGQVLEAQPWDTRAAIRMALPANGHHTFYVRHGDWLSRLAWPAAVLLFLFSALLGIRTRKMRS
ncbi:MAG: apolipoprotein N-acyltransferase [Chitinophagaceae bacterium]|nr:apolipoprotein N-acyltransferase [Chitinophagaceae bacterium]